MRRRLLVGMVAVLTGLAACGTPDDQVASGAGDPPGGNSAPGWTRLPDAPLSPRGGSLVVSVGDRVLVLGGSTQPDCHDTIVMQGPQSDPATHPEKPVSSDASASAAEVVLTSTATAGSAAASCVAPEIDSRLRDGAVLDLATRRWKAVAESPVTLAASSEWVLSGGRVWILVSPVFQSPGTDLLAYDPSSDSWQQFGRPPVDETAYLGLASVGERLVAYHRTHESGAVPDLLFDADTGKWSELVADPLGPSFDRYLVSTDLGAVLLGMELTENPGSEKPALVRAALLDPSGTSWKRLPDSEILGGYPHWRWVADRVVNASPDSADGGQVNNYGRAYPFGGILDPTTGEWSELPEGRAAGAEPCRNGAPWLGSFAADHAAGQRVIVHGRWALHVAERRWEQVACNPERADFASAVGWAGEEVPSGMLVFGGYDVVAEQNQGPTDFEFRNDAWLWQPEQ